MDMPIPTAINLAPRSPKASRITAEAGHQNERTTFEHYFHHPEPVIRFWVDKATASHLTAKALAPWIGKSPDALRQGHHRSTDKDCYLSDQLTQRALALYTPTQPTLPVELFAAKSMSEKTVQLNFTRLSKIVFDVAGGYQMSAIMSRNTVDEDQLVKACRAIAYVSSALEARHRKRHPLLSPNANNESCLEYAHDAIRRHRLDFSVGSEPHLDSMLGMLASKETLSEELSSAANAWIRCREGNYISLVDVNEALPLIKLLHTAAVPIANLIIRIQLSNPKDENCVTKALESADLIAIRSAFEQVFTAKVHLEGVNTKPDASVRTDRPKQYLLISRHRLKSGRAATSAGCRMNRFHGIMFTLAVMASLGKVA